MDDDGTEYELRRDAERYRWLRDHKCNQLYIDRDGDHACNYMTAAEWIDKELDGGPMGPDYARVPAEELQQMRDTNTIWHLQIYPATPIGSYSIMGATLDSVIDAAMEAQAPESASRSPAP